MWDIHIIFSQDGRNTALTPVVLQEVCAEHKDAGHFYCGLAVCLKSAASVKNLDQFIFVTETTYCEKT